MAANACHRASRIRRSRALSQARTTAEVVADGGEDDVGGVALATLEMAAAEVAIGLHVSDHGLRSPSDAAVRA